MIGMALPSFAQNHIQWFVCGAIIVLGLLVFGLFDVVRLSWRRIWAISSVCFAESYRRRVLLITPLAIIGVFIVSQLIKPLDEADAIRQTIKFCLFTTGLIITITAIILACTNLPKEIESRVIYTIVTKPATRLEIVLGKIIGFARISALILVIMGLFTFAYLHLRAWQFSRAIDAKLADAGSLDATTAETYRHYKEAGLLTSRSMRTDNEFQIFSRAPQQGDTRRYLPGNGEGDFIVPFQVTSTDLIPPGAPDAQPGDSGIVLALSVGFERDPTYVAPPSSDASNLPKTVAAPSTTQRVKPPLLMVQILDANQNTLIAARQINSNQPVEVKDPTGSQPVFAVIEPEAAKELTKKDQTQFYVYVSGGSPGGEYFVDLGKPMPPAVVIVPPAQGSQPREILPVPDSSGKPSPPRFRGRQGTAGQQLPGGSTGIVPVAVFEFDHAPPRQVDASGNVPFEIKCGIERGDEDDEGATDVLTQVEFTAVNRATGQAGPPVKLALESNRQAYFNMPASSLGDGDFDIRMRCLTRGHYVGLLPDSLAMIAHRESFDFNLGKSLLVIWLMSILVISVSIFCSTFLSWPIAIVLTLVILLGRWGVEQLGDATAPGIGPMVVQDLFGASVDPSKAKVVSASVEKLAAGLNALAAVLPDLSRFSSTEDLERGLAVPVSRLTDSLKVLGSYGLAVITLAYVFLRLKEVAP
jgi:hypothetical protein